MGKRPTIFIFIFISGKHLPLIYIALAVGLGLLFWAETPRAVFTTLPCRLALPGKRIVIDAGHGGIDPGAKGRAGLEEKFVTLEIAKELHRLFSRVGVYTVLTREDDRDLSGEGNPRYNTFKERDLWRRVEIANQSKADIFLSVHVNSFPQAIWSGAQTFYQEGEEESARLARAIQKQLVLRLGPNNRKAKAADYLVLRSTTMPAVTVEAGFISNPREEALLAQPEYRKKVAEAIFQGVVDYFCSKPARETAPAFAPQDRVLPPAPEHPLPPGQVRLYFADPNNEDIFLRQEIREIPGYRSDWDRRRLLEAVLAELERGPGERSALLPAAPVGHWVKSAGIFGNTAVVDLSPEFIALVDGGGASELLAICAIVNTLTDLPGINGVRFLLDGKSNCTVGGHVMLDQVFQRRMNIMAEK